MADEDDNRTRHDEEMRWIARAKEAEQKVENIDKWVLDMVAFLRKIVVPWPNVDSIRAQDEVALASQLLHKAFDLGIAEPGSAGQHFTGAPTWPRVGVLVRGIFPNSVSSPPCAKSIQTWRT
jgi:hypothetical protein